MIEWKLQNKCFSSLKSFAIFNLSGLYPILGYHDMRRSLTILFLRITAVGVFKLQ